MTPPHLEKGGGVQRMCGWRKGQRRAETSSSQVFLAVQVPPNTTTLDPICGVASRFSSPSVPPSPAHGPPPPESLGGARPKWALFLLHLPASSSDPTPRGPPAPVGKGKQHRREGVQGEPLSLFPPRQGKRARGRGRNNERQLPNGPARPLRLLPPPRAAGRAGSTASVAPGAGDRDGGA